MIAFVWPWVFALLPLPWLVRRLLPPARAPLGAPLVVTFFAALRQAAGSAATLRPRRPTLAHAVWLLLVLAAAQPQWIGDLRLIPTSGRDLMLVVDTSGSMRGMDFGSANDPLDRLEVVKMVAGRFVEERRGDRLGLILFGARPTLRAPLTHDRAVVQALLQESEIGLAGEHTAIGDAIGLAIRTMRERPSDSRVIVLLTDGVSNTGSLGPRQAARLAAAEGIRIHAIGMGVDDVAAPNLYGTWAEGGAREFNRAVLEELAETTGGSYFHALDRPGLFDAYRRIDALEPTLGEALRDYAATTLYPLPLAVAMLLSALLAGGLAGWGRRT